MNNRKEKNRYDALIKTFPKVFSEAYGNPRVTCMAYGCECGEGWYEPICIMSARLEELNDRYAKDGLVVKYGQIKEKFGLLTVYWNVESVPCKFRRVFSRPFLFISHFLRTHVNFQSKRILDKVGYYSEEWEEIDKKDFEEQNHPPYENHYGWKFEQRDGKYYRNRCIFHSPTYHSEVTSHRILHAIYRLFDKIGYGIVSTRETDRQEALRTYMYHMAERIINEATDDARNICECCGTRIGTKWSPKCQTTGWIKYLCEECAKNGNSEYIKNKGLYVKGEMIKSPEEYRRSLQDRYGDAWTENDDKRFEED